MPTPSQNRPIKQRFRVLVILTLLFLLAGITIWAGMVLGRRSAKVLTTDTATSATPLAVSGHSMAPTVIGPSRELTCPSCDHSMVVADIPPTPDSQLICRKCARSIPHSQWELSSPVPPDLVWIQSASGQELRRGQLVAIRWRGQRHLKRLVGLPGETISAKDARLFVDDVRIEDAFDSSPEVKSGSVFVCDAPARWKPSWHMIRTWGDLLQGDIHTIDSSWILNQEAWRGAPKSAWLFYRHRNPHGNLCASGVKDDYAVNATLKRRLNPCDRLMLDWNTKNSTTATIEIAFWSPEGSRSVYRTVHPSTASVQNQVSWYDATPRDGLPVSETQPIAIRVTAGHLDEISFVVSRRIEYRLTPTHDRDCYPMTLRDGEYFVLGDNVPVSVDSREFGPIKTSDILGICSR